MNTKTIAILYPGEMGHSIASVLIGHGAKTVTCLEGRSQRTAELAEKTGIINLPTLEDVAAQSDLIISVVTPSAAPAVGQQVARAISRTGRRALLADVNAISPMTSEEIGQVISEAGGRYLDACIIGGARELEKKAVFYVSGPDTDQFATLNDFGLNIEILGDRIGQASAFKMMYAGMTKGISSLAVELLTAAHTIGIYPQVMKRYRLNHPELVRFIEQVLPGLPFRAARRSEEMVELATVIEKEGLTPNMALGSMNTLKTIGDLNLRSRYSDQDEASWSLEDVVAILSRALKK